MKALACGGTLRAAGFFHARFDFVPSSKLQSGGWCTQNIAAITPAPIRCNSTIRVATP